MRIGITFDLKSSVPQRPGAPDDEQEEFDSPVTIKAVGGVLRDYGHDVVELGDGRPLVAVLAADPPDFVFNFAEGQGIGRSREARVPALCEMLGIPYSGSDPATLAVTLDKDCARRIAVSHGLRVPEGMLVSSTTGLDQLAAFPDQRFPVMVKPAWEGSSKGIRQRCLVHKPAELAGVVRSILNDYAQPILVEEFIEGDELTVGVLGNESPEVIGIMRVQPCTSTPHFVYSLEVKRDFRRQVRYDCPAQIPTDVTRAVSAAALKAYEIFGCRDVSRVDFRLRRGVPYFLELNPLPGINPESSDLVIMTDLLGWPYHRLVGSIFTAACRRYGLAERST
jgi:D-alanine-D-alanine ligase